MGDKEKHEMIDKCEEEKRLIGFLHPPVIAVSQ